jgi:lactate dehydrogenase-like 2-hydroxyacid dehydrogenase
MRGVPEDDLDDSAVNHSFLHTLAVATKSIDMPAGMGIIGFGRIGRLIFRELQVLVHLRRQHKHRRDSEGQRL